MFIQIAYNKLKEVIMQNPQEPKAENQELVSMVTSYQTTEQILELQLKEKLITRQGIIFLNQYNWTNLSLINLKVNKIGDSGWKWLCKMSLPNLVHLELVDTRASDAGIRHLSKANFPRLEELYIGDNGWRHGIDQLTKIKSQELQWISLAPYKGDKSGKMTTFDVNHLVKGKWKKLRSLFIPENFLMAENDQNAIRKKMLDFTANEKLSCKFC